MFKCFTVQDNLVCRKSCKIWASVCVTSSHLMAYLVSRSFHFTFVPLFLQPNPVIYNRRNFSINKHPFGSSNSQFNLKYIHKYPSPLTVYLCLDSKVDRLSVAVILLKSFTHTHTHSVLSPHKYWLCQRNMMNLSLLLFFFSLTSSNICLHVNHLLKICSFTAFDTQRVSQRLKFKKGESFSKELIWIIFQYYNDII